MEIGDDPQTIDFIDWHDLYARNDDNNNEIIPGLAYRGRWTAIAAPAKEGKSTVLLGLVIAAARAGFKVIYLDAEMGRIDMLDRVEDWMHLQPDDLTNLLYTDLPPKLSTVQGASILGTTVEQHRPDLVVIDGLNGVITGAENDDQPWRDLFEWAIAPMKAHSIAVLTTDNTGHTNKKRPRGHSVKIDKADAVIALERTNGGVKLTCELRRTSAFPTEQTFIVLDASEEGPPMTIRNVEGDYPAGTKELAAKLDRHNAPIEITQRAARRLLMAAGETAAQKTLCAAIKYRHGEPVEIRKPVENPREGRYGSDTHPSQNPRSEGATDWGVYVVAPHPQNPTELDDPNQVF